MAEFNIVPNPHAEAARKLVDKIRALRAEVPNFLIEVPPSERKKLIPNAAVRRELLESASVAIEESGRLAAIAGTDAAKMRHSYAYTLAYEAVVNELRAFAGAVAYSIRVERADAGASALDVLAVARRLARRKEGAALLPHVEAMQRYLHRGRRRNVAAPPAAPVPAEEQQRSS